jgi:hypothetical protein
MVEVEGYCDNTEARTPLTERALGRCATTKAG